MRQRLQTVASFKRSPVAALERSPSTTPLALLENMSNAIELYDEAEKLKDEGKLDEAVAKLNEALSHDAEYALAHSALAVVLQRLGEHEKAIQHAQRVCELEPNDPFSFTAMSVTYQRAYAGTNEMKFIQLAEEAMDKSRILSQGG